MGFFGFGVAAAAQPSNEPTIPEEIDLLEAMRAAYRDPNISTTKGMHEVRTPDRIFLSGILPDPLHLCLSGVCDS